MTRGAWFVAAWVLVGCGDVAEPCTTGVDLGEQDAGCDCAGDAFELFDNGTVCVCSERGLSCDTPIGPPTTSGECRRAPGVDCG